LGDDCITIIDGYWEKMDITVVMAFGKNSQGFD
jgi:hypothetical protein